MRSNILALAAAGLVLAACVWPAARAAEPGACRSDLQSLCSGVQPGGGRLLACLKANQARLAPDCQAALPVLERCAAQARRLCAEDAGVRERRSCLRDNAAQLGPECRGLAAAR